VADKDGDRPLVKWFGAGVLVMGPVDSAWDYMLSVEPGVIQSTNLAVKYKADVNLSGKFGRTPLCQAAANFSSRSVLRLIELGADIRAKCGEDKETPIEIAVRSCRAPTTAILLTQDPGVAYLESGTKGLLSSIEQVAPYYKKYQYSFANCDTTARLLKGEINNENT
jgi:Ankyrin repeats (many copies)